MGADNLRSFHRWQKWRGIADMVPIAVVDRLGPSLYAGASAAGQALARARIPETAARSLCRSQAPRLGLPARIEVAAVVDGIARCRAGCEYRTANAECVGSDENRCRTRHTAVNNARLPR